jgi:hypothetical protein
MTMVDTPLAAPPPVRTPMRRWLKVLFGSLFAVLTAGVAIGSYLAVDTLLRGTESSTATPQADVAVDTCRIDSASYAATLRVRNRGQQTAVFTIRVVWYNAAHKVVAEDHQQVQLDAGQQAYVEATAAKGDGSAASCAAVLA